MRPCRPVEAAVVAADSAAVGRRALADLLVVAPRVAGLLVAPLLPLHPRLLPPAQRP